PPRFRSPPAPREAVRDGAPYSAGAPWREPATGDRGLRESMSLRALCRLEQGAPMRDLAVDPIRARELRGTPPRPLGCHLCGSECGQARTGASPALVASKDVAPRKPTAPPALPRRKRRAV